MDKILLSSHEECQVGGIVLTSTTDNFGSVNPREKFETRTPVCTTSTKRNEKRTTQNLAEGATDKYGTKKTYVTKNNIHTQHDYN